jgi:hypothetical protein
MLWIRIRIGSAFDEVLDPVLPYISKVNLEVGKSVQMSKRVKSEKLKGM